MERGEERVTGDFGSITRREFAFYNRVDIRGVLTDTCPVREASAVGGWTEGQGDAFLLGGSVSM